MARARLIHDERPLDRALPGLGRTLAFSFSPLLFSVFLTCFYFLGPVGVGQRLTAEVERVLDLPTWCSSCPRALGGGLAQPRHVRSVSAGRNTNLLEMRGSCWAAAGASPWHGNGKTT